ncbi:MAG: hypothetical protein LBT46_07805 [Planctomycetaceae bacterium]|jgi:hypothetical protein|nr:hypothetical protein [Planctomycetaceae bacterium]
MSNTTERLTDLDKKHSDLLDRLSVLDTEIAAVLREWTQIKENDSEEPKAAMKAAA